METKKFAMIMLFGMIPIQLLLSVVFSLFGFPLPTVMLAVFLFGIPWLGLAFVGDDGPC